MPRTGYKSNNALSIELDRWQTFTPGDVISGMVQRTAPLVDNNTTVTLRLFGRAKSKITVKHQHGSSNYRNRFNFFDDSSAWTLFEGPLQVSGDTQSWRFEAQIPIKPAASALAATKNPDTSFLPLDPQNIEGSTIPSVFYYKGANFWSSTTVIAHVEYYLEAELKPSKGSSCNATLPLFVYTPGSYLSAKDTRFDMVPISECLELPPSLVAPNAHGLGAKKKSFFSRSKVPEFRFNVNVGHPAQVQLGNEITFFIGVVPLGEDADITEQKPSLTFRLEAFELTLKSTTNAVCPGTFSPKRVAVMEKYTSSTKDVLKNLGDAISLPFGLDCKPLNIGNVLQLVLENDGIYVAGQRIGKAFKPQLAPDFTTFCISHTHQISWELRVEVCGKIRKIAGEASVQLLGPSREKIEATMSELSDDEKKERLKLIMGATETGIEGLTVISDIVQAFAS